jgi:hypothetical protein
MNEQYWATFLPKASPLAWPTATGPTRVVAWPMAESAGPSGAHLRTRRARRRGHRAVGSHGGAAVAGGSATSVWR